MPSLKRSSTLWEDDLKREESKTGWEMRGGMLSHGVNGKTKRYPKGKWFTGFLKESNNERDVKRREVS